MRTSWEAVGLVSVVGALLACGGATKDQLKTRAAFDLNCSEGEVQVIKLDSKTRGVSGCGRRATYVESCDGPPSAIRQCTWVMNVVSNTQSGVTAENEIASEATEAKAEPPVKRKKATHAPQRAEDEAEPEVPSETPESETASAATDEGSALEPAQDAGAELAGKAKKPGKKRKPPMIGY